MGKGMGIGMEARYKPKTKESGFVSPLLLVPGGGGGGFPAGGPWGTLGKNCEKTQCGQH